MCKKLLGYKTQKPLPVEILMAAVILEFNVISR
nr:MAG TPA: hypothetical protein [Caudoviricetes sp.]